MILRALEKEHTPMTAVPTTSLPLRAGRWTVDPNHSGVLFMVRHLGLSNVRGRFDRFDATLDVGESRADTTVAADIDMSSVDTNNADRDAHLRSTDFFDTEKHPTMSFRSTSVEADGDQFELRGDLTINGVTRPVTLDVEYFGTEVYPVDQRLHAGFAATTTIRRSDFGIDFGLTLGGDKVLLGDKIKVELDLQFVEPLVAVPSQ
jgi:polyisoprenoid-binding protein YceI